MKNSRAKNLAIRINQQGKVRVTIPRHLSQRRAESFFLSKQQWVLKRLDGLNHRDCNKTLPPEGGRIWIRDREFQVQLLRGEKSVEEAVWRLLGEEARRYLPGRVAELSDLHGYTITGLKIRKMKTRWGSCTARKSINLNSWLIMLPGHLSDYVILHELVHTRIPDHSKRYWKELDGLTGGLSKKFRRELHSHQILCFPE
ncbi:MAG: SprT family zinc-dependent metalloprotease [Bacteroidales bacterium]|nr:SprT family zinc-dependent metalloprotease [Bacteroidales bacterium]